MVEVYGWVGRGLGRELREEWRVFGRGVCGGGGW